MASGESCGEEPPAGNGRSATTHVQVVDGEPYLSAIPLCRVCDSDSCYGVSLCQDKSRKGVVAFILYRFTKFKILSRHAQRSSSRCGRCSVSPLMAFHGGQEWQLLPNFVEDLSVTTNGLGPPEAALAAAREAVGTAQHYPPMSFEPQRSELARFLWGASAEHATDRLLLGNGASELIDLLTRDAASASDGAQRWWWCDRRPRPPLALSPPRPLAAYYLLLL